MNNTAISPLRVSPVEGEKIGDYTILSTLGEGTFGTVYKVIDGYGKVLALKLLRLYELFPIQERQNVAKRFQLEFNTAKISSPQLVASYEQGSEKGNPYFTMQFCSKGSLRNKVGANIEEKFAKRIAVDVLKGLKTLHENGKIHRDLKPDNILLDENDNARLTDFGIAGHLNLEKTEMNEREVRLTTTDILGRPKERFGSYPYMPPEQIKPPNRIVTKIPANDMFSFGATMFEIITGNLPYGTIRTEAELAQYIAKVNKGQWTPISSYRTGFNSNWQRIIEGCLQPDYKKRFSNVQDVLDLLGIEETRSNNKTAGVIVLKVMQGEDYNKEFNLSQLLKDRNIGLLTIGRKDTGAKNHIEISDQLTCYISRHHATIEKQDSTSWFIRDGQWRNITGQSGWIKSTNGTFVNGVEINSNGVRLKLNDIITLGDTTLKVLD